MKVDAYFRTDPERPIADPLPEKKWSLVFRLMAGDVCDPLQLGGANWFTPPYPKRVLRFWLPRYTFPVLASVLLVLALLYSAWLLLLLPFIPGYWLAWRLNMRGGYMGMKCYAVDSPAYKEWPVGIKPEDVYPGSLALCFSVRPFADMTHET